MRIVIESSYQKEPHLGKLITVSLETRKQLYKCLWQASVYASLLIDLSTHNCHYVTFVIHGTSTESINVLRFS